MPNTPRCAERRGFPVHAAHTPVKGSDAKSGFAAPLLQVFQSSSGFLWLQHWPVLAPLEPSLPDERCRAAQQPHPAQQKFPPLLSQPAPAPVVARVPAAVERNSMRPSGSEKSNLLSMAYQPPSINDFT